MVDRRLECYGSPPRGKTAVTSLAALYSADCKEARSAAAAATTTKGTVLDAVRISMSSAASLSSQEEGDAIGDLFMWGEGIGEGVLGGGSEKIGAKADALLPKIVRSAVVLDVHNVACGVRHAALVTKQGEVFSWGEECGGRLGHGVDADVSHPQLIDSLASLIIQSVCCGEYHTCAVSQSGDLYTWGDGAHHYGLLGHGNSISHWTPKRISGSLEGIRVASVACGPWHTFLTTSAGQLFSFGDGTFGVLGHGDRQNVSSPKEIESLKGLKTLKVACGPWHTAAVIEVMVGYSDSNSSNSGKLFTWGDGDKNRLGHGDKEQKLVPTCVAAVVDYNFRQVACGHSLTVALSTSGQIFTMGSAAYGQLGDPQAVGNLPGVLRLGKTFVEEIGCGSYHVAALTSKSEVFTWGKGANGRLGHGDLEDRYFPTIVEALKDRQVKRLACGSSFTAAICLHKSAPGTGCSGCRQPFGFTRKKHHCYNCGFAYCHNCSARKALYAALSPNPRKPYRVCDTCFLKLCKRGAVFTKENLEQQQEQQIKQVDVKGIRRSKRPDLSSRVCPMPSSSSLLQWGSVNTPATFKASHRTEVSKSLPQSRVGSRAVSPLSRRPSPPRSATPTVGPTIGGFASSLPCDVEEVKRKNENLLLEVSGLRAQVDKLTRRCKSHEKELLDSSKQIQEAFAAAGVESAKCKAAKEVIMSLTAQLKDLAERMPAGLYHRSTAAYRPEQSSPAAENAHVQQVSDVDCASKPEAQSHIENGEREWVEQDQPGVYITLTALPGGGKDLKRVRFSRKQFSEKQAEIWWQENRQRVYEHYNLRGKLSGAC